MKGAEVVANTTDHVFRRVDAVNEGPKPEEAPREQQFEPNDHEIKVGEERKLGSSIVVPVRICQVDSADVDKMQDELHGEEDHQESEAIANGSGSVYRCGAVLGLRDVLVKGKDRTSEVERPVDSISQVISERVVLGFCRDGNPVPL